MQLNIAIDWNVELDDGERADTVELIEHAVRSKAEELGIAVTDQLISQGVRNVKVRVD